MRQLTKLNISESVSKKRLVFKESWFDIFDRFMVYFTSITIAVSGFLVCFDIKNKNDAFLFWAFFFPLSLFSIYMFYRKATEKKLYVLATPYNKEENWQMLLGFAENRSLDIYRRAKGCLIFNEATDEIHAKTMIFMIRDNMVMFTIIRDEFRFNFPTFTAHLFLRHDMKKLFRKTAS